MQGQHHLWLQPWVCPIPSCSRREAAAPQQQFQLHYTPLSSFILGFIWPAPLSSPREGAEGRARAVQWQSWRCLHPQVVFLGWFSQVGAAAGSVPWASLLQQPLSDPWALCCSSSIQLLSQSIFSSKIPSGAAVGSPPSLCQGWTYPSAAFQGFGPFQAPLPSPFFLPTLPALTTLAHSSDPVPSRFLLPKLHASHLSPFPFFFFEFFLAGRSTEKKSTTLLSACFPIQWIYYMLQNQHSAFLVYKKRTLALKKKRLGKLKTMLPWNCNILAKWKALL